MKNKVYIFIFILIGLFLAGGIYAETAKGSYVSINSQIEQLTDNLKAEIIPIKGTSKAEVDKIFGEAEEIKKMRPGDKGLGNPPDYPMHIYQLLPPKNNMFRVFLYVTYKEDKVYHADINHVCALKGRPVYSDPAEIEAKNKAIEGEKRYILIDLLEIYGTYYEKLKNASWNKLLTNQ